MLGGNQGVSPYGSRYDSMGVKGKGYFGMLQNTNGISSEISSADESGDYPLLVPTLSHDQVKLLLSNQQPTDDIYKKARDYADLRRSNGQSPFYDGQGLYFPTPKY